MARPSRSKRQAERARLRQGGGDPGQQPASRPATRKRGPARAHLGQGPNQRATALSDGVPLVVKVGVGAVLVLIVIFLASLGR